MTAETLPIEPDHLTRYELFVPSNGLCEVIACRERSRGKSVVELTYREGFNAEICCELETGLELLPNKSREVLDDLYTEFQGFVRSGPNSQRERYWGRLAVAGPTIELQ